MVGVVEIVVIVVVVVILVVVIVKNSSPPSSRLPNENGVINSSADYPSTNM